MWERFTEFHLNLVMYHPAKGCSYFSARVPSQGNVLYKITIV